MKLPAIGPFLAAGVALLGAAAIVANPVPPPPDISVSAADYAASGNGLDVLDPRCLESIGASRQGWQNPLEVLEQLLSGLVDGDSDVDPKALESLAGVIDVGQPALLQGALTTASIEGLPGGVVRACPPRRQSRWGRATLTVFCQTMAPRRLSVSSLPSALGSAKRELRSSNRSGWRRPSAHRRRSRLSGCPAATRKRRTRRTPKPRRVR